ncbi:S41 family peptidase [Flagellimonas flava]|uniref:Peptidase family S41 n=1 Tax=Flagellimonas flava TaxID=570519 RepID=A0A1M5IJC1_9FLAO|nr:S41 family peptidase [Allomuricauda flava]SHG28438.1 Peptidase family S41 [Allomuricauda flava]
MKKYIFLTLIVCASFRQELKGQQFGQKEILQDLDYLYESLIEAHYDVYAYVTPIDFRSNYQRVRNSITKDSLSLLETTNVFQKVISAVNNGHTEIDFPGASYGAYAHSGGTVFPLEIAFENGKSWVRKNFSDHQEIQVGTEITHINGETMQAILANIYPQVSAERTYFKNAKIEMYSFPRYYWQIFGEQDTFEVDLVLNGTSHKIILNAINLIEGYEMKRNEVLNATMTLRIDDTAAYLNPGNFSGDEARYQRFIDSSFVEIKKNQSKNLIVDLRNNGGGNDSFSDYLVSYLADKPFKWNSSFTLKTSQFLKEHTRKNNDTTQIFFKEILRHDNGEVYDYAFDAYQPQEKEKRFHGKVYVLVNRQSHSQSAVTAAQIQDYNFGTIVGEETGDYPSLYASQFQYALPNTGIPVKVSKGRIVRVNGSTKSEGVIPDIEIQDHLLDEKDEILEGLLDRLNHN